MTMKTCLDNLHNCHSSCCKSLVILLPNQSEQQIDAFIKLGCSVDKVGNSQHRILIPSTCKQLKDELCSLHDTPEKPKICVRLDWNTKQMYHLTEGCMYKEEQNGILETT